MLVSSLTRRLPAFALLLALPLGASIGSGAALAQAPQPVAPVAPTDPANKLTPEELAERELRKDCKLRICAAFHNRKPDGGDIACNVVKSWRKSQLDKLMSKAKVSWPWGAVRCTADIKLKRATLIQALTADKHEAAIDAHNVVCEVSREDGPKSEISFAFAPKVTFEKGKATKAVLNWGKVKAPTLVKGAIWTATATDNTFNVLQGTVVEDINNFIGPRCDEVKAEWQSK